MKQTTMKWNIKCVITIEAYIDMIYKDHRIISCITTESVAGTATNVLFICEPLIK